jgi:translocator protein
MSNPKIALIFTPLIFSLITSFLTGKVDHKDYKKAWFEPPGYVFMLVWTSLYIMLGFILYQSVLDNNQTSLWFLITILFLTYLWQYFFNYKKYYKLAIFTLFLTLLFSLELLVELIIENWNKNYLFTYIPFVAWILYALILSSHTKKIKINK